MELKKTIENEVFRGVEVDYEAEFFFCPDCELDVGTIEQTGKMQRAMSESYRKKVGLLTGAEIRKHRKRLDLTQKALAARMATGVASIKRWEGAVIQSASMDKALRNAFWGGEPGENCTGNRKFSLSRVKLVIRYLESASRQRLLAEGDKMLFTAKYLWYADFVAYREMGKSMTGATYAALPYGPQLNNYRELAEPINLLFRKSLYVVDQ